MKEKIKNALEMFISAFLVGAGVASGIVTINLIASLF